MNSSQPAPGSAAPHRDWTRRLVNVLVALVVIAVAGATFVFSYDGVHAIALLGGVSPGLARYYPGLFDAVLVIASVTALMLRGERWWTRLWAWLVIIIVLGAIGTSDVLHAMNYSLRHRPTEGIVAAVPAVVVLLAFSLLLTLLRQPRAHVPSAPEATPLDVPAFPAAVSVLPIALPAASVASPAVPAGAAPAAEPQDAQTEPVAAVPVPTVPVPVVLPPAPVPVPADSLLPDVPPAAPEPAADETPQVPRDAAPAEDAVPAEEEAVPAEEVVAGKHAAPEEALPQEVPPREAHPPTEPNEVIPAAAPAPESPAVPDEPAPPAEPAPPTVEVPALTVSPVPERSRGIRYAGNGVRGTPPSPDYWEADDTEQFAGLVYRARDDEDQDDDVPADRAAARPTPPELDDDAPPFATAPFAPMPRLNRVRSMPAPPADEDE